VKEIVPLLTERTIKTGLRIDRLDRIAREAAEQSGRGMIPVIHEPMSFEAALTAKPAERTDVFLHTGPAVLPWATAVREATAIGCHIGPEGGWTEKEANLAMQHGVILGSLGPLILRGETAAIIASYLAVRGE